MSAAIGYGGAPAEEEEEEEEEVEEGGVAEGAGELLDLRGNPISSARSLHLGGWRAAILVLGAVGATNVGFAGVFLNLVLYLTNVWGRTNAAAANDVTTVNGTMFCCAVVGAFLSDAYLGRFWGCTIFLVLYVLGCGAFSAFVAVTGTSKWQWVCLNLSLYMTAIGYDAFEPAMSALGGDQLDRPEEKGAFFNLFFVLSNVGQGVGLLVLSSLQYAGLWTLGFGIGAVMTAVGLLFVLAGTPIFRQYRPGGNPLARIAQVLVAAIRKTKLFGNNHSASLSSKVSKVSVAGMAVNSPLVHMPLSSHHFQLVHTDRFSWLDNAAMKDGGPNGRWRICTVAQVEEVKCLVSIFPIWFTGVVYNVTVAQLTTVFTEQGILMGQPSWLTIPATSLQVFTIATNVVFGMVYDVVITRLRQSKGVSQLQRMGMGLLVALSSMMVAAAVEAGRLHYNAQNIRISLFWLIPQYILVGISQVLMVVAQMEFFYLEVSPGMKSLGSCLPLLARAFGNYTSTILVDIVSSLTTRNGNPGWISQDLNEGHLDYFYWTVAGLLAVDFLVFLSLARSYTYLDFRQKKEGLR